MEKMQKLDYLQSMEQYLDQNEVYELFGDLLKEVITYRPEKPLDFIMEKLKQAQGKRIEKWKVIVND